MGIATLPESQYMKVEHDESIPSHFDSNIVWDSENLAKAYEQQSRIMRNLEKDQVVNNLQRVLKALDARDDTRYCFVLSGETLLTSDGFRVRTEQKDVKVLRQFSKLIKKTNFHTGSLDEP